jgi:HAE1 family hydrophobic/amphiphilic exporter-1
MMCARLLKPEVKQHGWLYRVLERGFDELLALYERGLKVVFRHQFATLMVMMGTIIVTGYLYVIIPKGFFPQQDTGMIVGITEASQDISFPAMVERQQAVINVLLQDPAIASVGSNIGAGGATATSPTPISPPSRTTNHANDQGDQPPGGRSQLQGPPHMQAAQDITIGG